MIQFEENIKIADQFSAHIIWMHKDAMLSYFSIGGLKCGAIYRLAYNNEEWAKAFEKNSTNRLTTGYPDSTRAVQHNFFQTANFNSL